MKKFKYTVAGDVNKPSFPWPRLAGNSREFPLAFFKADKFDNIAIKREFPAPTFASQEDEYLFTRSPFVFQMKEKRTKKTIDFVSVHLTPGDSAALARALEFRSLVDTYK